MMRVRAGHLQEISIQTRQSPHASSDFVDLREYGAVLRRRAVVIAIVALVGLGLALGYSKLQTPIYTSTAKVLVKAPPGTATEDPTKVISMETEAQVVKSAPIASAAAETLGSTIVATRLLKHVSVQTSVDSFVMSITYADPNPTQAALGANAFAKAYLDYKRQEADDQIKEQQALVQTQIGDIQEKQREQNQILQNSDPDSTEYRNAKDALDELRLQLTLLETTLVEQSQLVDPGHIILPAQTPRQPSSPKVPLNSAIGLFFGLLLGVVAAFVLDRMDDRIFRESDLQLYLDAPLLALVPHVKGNLGRSSQLVVHRQPRSHVSEAYRTIRTSVLSMAKKRDLKVIAVVSPVQGEGKSMTCANLAAGLAQTDKRVLIVSADIRKPRLHEFFGVPNDQGLTNVLEGEIAPFEAIESSEVANLWVLPGGPFAAQPAELLQSPEMDVLIDAVRREFDFVLLDCPPVLGLADCLAVVPLADAVLLVVQAGKSRGGAISEVNDRLDRVGAVVDAVIMNDVRVARGRPGHHRYGYYADPNEELVWDRGRRRAAGRLPQPSPMTPLAGTEPRPVERANESEGDPTAVGGAE